MNNNGIMYPITVPPNTIPDSEVIMCDGWAGGFGRCYLERQLGRNAKDRFLRRNDLPPSLVPRGWAAWAPWYWVREREIEAGAERRWYYSCPACNSQFDDANWEHYGASQSQYPDEAGTGRAGLTAHIPLFHRQKSHVEYLKRVRREMSQDYYNRIRDFERQHGRLPHGTTEYEAILQATGLTNFVENVNQDKMRIIEILRKLNIPFPPQNQQRDLDYIETLINLIPEDYPKKNKQEQEPTIEDLKEEAKKLFKNHPEHLRLAIEQIDKNERKKRAQAAILIEMRNKYYKDKKGKKRTRDDKDGDGSGKDPRKKSKRGGRRTRRKSRRRKSRKKTRKKRRRRKKKTKRKR